MSERTFKILITGGGQGLGRKIAEYLYKEGHEIFILDKSDQTEIDPSLASILAGYIKCDLSNTEETEACFSKNISDIGRVDVLINNASGKKFKELENFAVSEIRENINIEFTAPLILSNLCLDIMKKNNFGRIINISSISAYRVHSRGTIYCSCKRAINVFGECLAKELDLLHGTITVNTICPDSFTKLDGTREKDYHFITNTILTNINLIIRSHVNGKVFNVFTFKHRLRESLRILKMAGQMVIT